MINISHVFIDKEIENAVIKVLSSGSLVQGDKVKKLEEKLTKINRTKYSVVVNSGTAALHTALKSIGVEEGDEVITTPFSFIATVNAILMCSAKPVFVDIDETYNINPNLIESKITKKTKAILTVDLYGQACDYEKIKGIARKYNLKIISDSSQAIGAQYKNKPIAKWVDVACFSFYATKNILMGEGGALVTDHKNIYEFARRFRQHGQDMKKPYVYHHIGYNYRSTDILAVIGLIQVSRLSQLTNQRRTNAKKLIQGLQDIPGIILPQLLNDREHVFHQFTIRVTDRFPFTRDKLHLNLLKNGVRTAVYYPSIIPLQPHIREITSYKKNMYPVAQRLSKQVLSLPVHPQLKNSDIKRIVDLIKKINYEKN